MYIEATGDKPRDVLKYRGKETPLRKAKPMPTLDKETIERTLAIIIATSTLYPIATSALYRWRAKSRDKRINIPSYKVRGAVLAHKAIFAEYVLTILTTNIILVAFYREYVSLGVFILAILSINLCCLTFGAAVNATLLLHFNDKKWYVVDDFEMQTRGVESGTPPRCSWVIQRRVEEELEYPVRTVKNNTP